MESGCRYRSRCVCFDSRFDCDRLSAAGVTGHQRSDCHVMSGAAGSVAFQTCVQCHQSHAVAAFIVHALAYHWNITLVCAQDLGSSEIFPSYLRHNSNGRFVVVCGDGEYVVYTALAWRNKSFGSGAEFVWAAEPNDFAVRTTKPDAIKAYKNFKVRPLAGAVS